MRRSVVARQAYELATALEESPTDRLKSMRAELAALDAALAQCQAAGFTKWSQVADLATWHRKQTEQT